MAEGEASEGAANDLFTDVWHIALIRQIERWRAAGIEANEFAQPFFDDEHPADGTPHEIDDDEFVHVLRAVNAEGFLCVHAAKQLDRALGVLVRSLDPGSDRGRACQRARSAFDAMTISVGEVKDQPPKTRHLRDLLEHFDDYVTGRTDGHYFEDVGSFSMLGSNHGPNPSVVWFSESEGSTVWIGLHLEAVEAWERDHVAPLFRRG